MEDIKILRMTVDETDDDSYYHLLVDGQHFKYISIESGSYDFDDLCFPPGLLSNLPQLLPGNWNLGHLAMSAETASPCFAWTTGKNFSSIETTWHPTYVDFLSLKLGNMLLLNVYEATLSQFVSPVIATFARFPWEIGYYSNETLVYSWIEGHDIGPKFLGHITEEGRVIGFLLAKVEGRHAGINDLHHCRAAVSSLHRLGICHGDLNRHNFLVSSSRAYLVDFEAARRTDDQQILDGELHDLGEQLRSKSRKGGSYAILPDSTAD